MPPRASSPARSENEFDIGDNLLGDNLSDDGHSTENEDNVRKSIHAGQREGKRALDMLHDVSDDDEAVIAQQLAASNRKASNLKGKTVKKGGGFQAMGLNANLLKAITRKGFSVPTPIQRKTIPLLLNDKDVVGMARTGSGKTAAFVIPMVEKLKLHSNQVGARALILSPSRELALQTLYVVKELGKGTDLRSILLVGGDSLEEQFAAMSSNPDVIIATPGRFVHLQVEMKLDLSSIRYVVFDEADRLFEMGFAAQLTEILHALPTTRQTLLFSATLPKTLVEFARAGLQDPILVRLDADSKISPDLQSSFFTVKSSEKEGALLHILQDVIRIPTGSQLLSSIVSEGNDVGSGKKRKRDGTESGSGKEVSNPYSTIVFAATKHHVEYLSHLLRLAGYAVSHVYGSLDQTARKLQVQAFRNGQTNVLVVTDVAARGIDIPVLANVVNYDFPSQPKIYVHRVGRTARAGQKGSSYSIVTDADAPYLLDLQLFLGRKLVVGRTKSADASLAEDVVVGSLQRDTLQPSCEWVSTNLESDADLAALRSVAAKGNKLYQRTRNSASAESAKRAKGIVNSSQWSESHPLFNDEASNLEAEREKMLARVSGFRPQESVFEFSARRGGRKGNEDAIEAMQNIRSGLDKKRQRAQIRNESKQEQGSSDTEDENDGANTFSNMNGDVDEASDSELEITFTGNSKTGRGSEKTNKDAQSYRDAENFMSYTPSNYNFHEDQAYGVHSGTNANFTEAARGATMDLAGDETGKNFGEARSVMRWDKRHKKYVNRANDEDGSKGKRLVRGESGAKIAASFRSGRYDAWKKTNRITKTPRVGETETNGPDPGPGPGHRFRHKSMKAPKAADKFRDDYDKKKKKFSEIKQREREAGMNGKTELQSVDDIRKQRNLKEKRRDKNARPSKKIKR